MHDYCQDCFEALAGPSVKCAGCLKEMHPECAMYQTPDGTKPRCERCHWAHKSATFLKHAKGNAEGTEERPPRKITGMPW